MEKRSTWKKSSKLKNADEWYWKSFFPKKSTTITILMSGITGNVHLLNCFSLSQVVPSFCCRFVLRKFLFVRSQRVSCRSILFRPRCSELNESRCCGQFAVITIVTKWQCHCRRCRTRPPPPQHGMAASNLSRNATQCIMDDGIRSERQHEKCSVRSAKFGAQEDRCAHCIRSLPFSNRSQPQ